MIIKCGKCGTEVDLPHDVRCEAFICSDCIQKDLKGTVPCTTFDGLFCTREVHCSTCKEYPPAKKGPCPYCGGSHGHLQIDADLYAACRAKHQQKKLDEAHALLAKHGIEIIEPVPTDSPVMSFTSEQIHPWGRPPIEAWLEAFAEDKVYDQDPYDQFGNDRARILLDYVKGFEGLVAGCFDLEGETSEQFTVNVTKLRQIVKRIPR